ncbi:MAG: hypothetical protein M3Y86_09835 [Verrucomicrobiota bacterium]|nr:hypothetical protein [Verrucomicrobiota bacterium]
MPYRIVPDFFQLPAGTNLGEVSGVALNSQGHIFVFQRRKPMLMEFDHDGKYLRELGDGLFDQPTDVAFGKEGAIFVSDGDGNSRIMKFDRTGKFLKS